MSGPRYLAVKLLNKTFRSGSYSNIQLSGGLDSSDLSPQDKKLCSVLYYGVIERRITLDCAISSLSSRPLNKLDDVVLNILRCGIYQLKYMENIPDNAAVNESVALVKKFGKTSASGMVNAILRNFIRSGKEIAYKGKSGYEAMSVEYSVPAELVKSLMADYGEELARDLLSNALEKPPVYMRRNRLRCTEAEFAAALDGITAEPDTPEDCWKASGGDVTATEAFRKGYFHVQDKSSQLCCMALAPAENDTVLDICAAPGGKTFTMAELMNGRGRIYAFDLHEKRVKLIRSGAERLGLGNITASAGDATKYNSELPKFTKILCDVPCSGFGVIGRKPEIKYKSLSEFERLPDIQYAIAENALRYLAVGGEMVYSTCTLRRAENEAVVERLLAAHPEIEPAKLPEPLDTVGESMASIFPRYFHSDGFFIAKLKKVR